MYVKCFENKKGILINALIFSSINEAFFFFLSLYGVGECVPDTRHWFLWEDKGYAMILTLLDQRG